MDVDDGRNSEAHLGELSGQRWVACGELHGAAMGKGYDR